MYTCKYNWTVKISRIISFVFSSATIFCLPRPVCITVLNSYSGWALVAEAFVLYGIAFQLGLIEGLFLWRQIHATMHPLFLYYAYTHLSLSLLFTYSEGSPLIHVNFNTLMLWQGFLLKSNVLTIVGSLIGFSGRGPSELGAVISIQAVKVRKKGVGLFEV